MVHLFAQIDKAAPVPAEDQKRDVAIWLVRTKVLREEILHDLLEDVLTMDKIFWFGAPSADQNRRIASADARFRKRVLGHAKDAIRALDSLKAVLVEKILVLNNLPPLPATRRSKPMPADSFVAWCERWDLQSVGASAVSS